MNMHKLVKGKRQRVGLPLLRTGLLEHREHLSYRISDFQEQLDFWFALSHGH